MGEGKSAEVAAGGSWLAGMKSLWMRLWRGKPASGGEGEWQSDIDFQKMARELVESAELTDEGRKAGPATMAEAVVDLARLSKQMSGLVVLMMHSNLALEKRVRWLERGVIAIGCVVLVFLGMMFAALLC